MTVCRPDTKVLFEVLFCGSVEKRSKYSSFGLLDRWLAVRGYPSSRAL
jgi:hypothetical protein